MRINDRLTVAFAYLFGIPALYLVLTDDKKKGYVSYHVRQAFFLWVLFFLAFFGIRYLIDLIWRIRYIPFLSGLEILAAGLMAGYAIFCAYSAFAGKDFKAPFDFNDKRKISRND